MTRTGKEEVIVSYWMHPETGSVDTEENWKADFEKFKMRGRLDEWGSNAWNTHLVHVVMDSNGEWIEAEGA